MHFLSIPTLSYIFCVGLTSNMKIELSLNESLSILVGMVQDMTPSGLCGLGIHRRKKALLRWSWKGRM